MNVGVKKRLRHCFGVRADWAARLRGSSLVGGRGLGAWLRQAATGGIVRCLLVKGRVGAGDGLAPAGGTSWPQSAFEGLFGGYKLPACHHARRESNAPSMRVSPAGPITRARAAISFSVSVPGWRSTWAYSDIGKSIASAHCCAVSPDASRARVSQFFTPPPFP